MHARNIKQCCELMPGSLQVSARDLGSTPQVSLVPARVSVAAITKEELVTLIVTPNYEDFQSLADPTTGENSCIAAIGATVGVKITINDITPGRRNAEDAATRTHVTVFAQADASSPVMSATELHDLIAAQLNAIRDRLEGCVLQEVGVVTAAGTSTCRVVHYADPTCSVQTGLPLEEVVAGVNADDCIEDRSAKRSAKATLDDTGVSASVLIYNNPYCNFHYFHEERQQVQSPCFGHCCLTANGCSCVMLL